MEMQDQVGFSLYQKATLLRYENDMRGVPHGEPQQPGRRTSLGALDTLAFWLRVCGNIFQEYSMAYMPKTRILGNDYLMQACWWTHLRVYLWELSLTFHMGIMMRRASYILCDNFCQLSWDAVCLILHELGFWVTNHTKPRFRLMKSWF